MSVSQQPATGDGDSGDRPDFPLSDAPLLDLLDALVNGLGKVDSLVKTRFEEVPAIQHI